MRLITGVLSLPTLVIALSFAFASYSAVGQPNGLRSECISTSSLPVILTNSLSALSNNSGALKDVILTGNVSWVAGSDRDNGTITLKAIEGGYTRVSLVMASQSIEEVTTIDSWGIASGSRQDANGTTAKLRQNLVTSPYWFEPELLLRAYCQDGSWQKLPDALEQGGVVNTEHVIMARQIQSSNTMDALRIQSATDVEVDVNSALPRMISYQEFSEKTIVKPVSIRIAYSEFTLVDGHQIPFHIQRLVNGTLTMDIRLTKAVLNSNLGNGEFTSK